MNKNLPQLALAVWLILFLNELPDPIVFMSMSFSAISIIIAIISMCTARKLINSQDYYSIEFDVKGSMIGTEAKKYRNNVSEIKGEICKILGLNEQMIEFLRPTQIPNGIKIHFNIYMNNTNAIDMKCEKLINDANESGQLPKLIEKAWDLSEEPGITNIKYERHASKISIQNSVTIQMQTVRSVEMSDLIESRA